MYSKILIALDATEADETILNHVSALARSFDSAVVILHVADGWAARLFGANAVSREITEDKAYLETVRARLAAEGLRVEAEPDYQRAPPATYEGPEMKYRFGRAMEKIEAAMTVGAHA